MNEEYRIVVRDVSLGLAKPFVKSAKKVKVFSSNTVDSLPGIVKKEHTLMNNKFSNGVALTGRKISSLAYGSVDVASTALLYVVGGALPQKYRKKIVKVYNHKYNENIDVNDLAISNIMSNVLTYSAIGSFSAVFAFSSVSDVGELIAKGILLGSLATLVESVARASIKKDYGYFPGSLLGNIVSLPVLAGEGVYKLGKGAYKLGASINRSRKDYLSGVKARANKIKSLEQKDYHLVNNLEEHFDANY